VRRERARGRRFGEALARAVARRSRPTVRVSSQRAPQATHSGVTCRSLLLRHRRLSKSLMKRWTRTQSIRTAGALPFKAALVETLEPPVYQQIARKALHLRELGMSDRVIAGRLGVTDKTIAKAIAWVQKSLAE
jgi:hypothetical protein